MKGLKKKLARPRSKSPKISNGSTENCSRTSEAEMSGTASESDSVTEALSSLPTPEVFVSGEENNLETLALDTANAMEAATEEEREETVEDLLEELWGIHAANVSLEDKESVMGNIKRKLGDTFPDFFYDFCVISSERDTKPARELKALLEKYYSLKGCMIEDLNFALGDDVFIAYEGMMERSTKVFFYISENFNRNSFFQRIQNGAVFNSIMTKAKNEKGKCVPAFPLEVCKVPLALSGLAGIELGKAKEIMDARIEVTYTPEVRQERRNREREERLRHLLSLLEHELQELRRRQDSPQPSLTNESVFSAQLPSNAASSCDTGSVRSSSFSSLPTGGSVSPGMVPNLPDGGCVSPGLVPNLPEGSGIASDLLRNLPAATVSGEFNITESARVQIGHVYNIHIHKTSATDDESESEPSDESDGNETYL